MKIKEGGGMDLQKGREAFEAWVVENLAEGLSMSWEDWCWKSWQAAKAQAVLEGFVLVEKAKLMQIIGSVSMIEPITRGNPYMDSVKHELTAITDVVKTVIEAQEPAND